MRNYKVGVCIIPIAILLSAPGCKRINQPEENNDYRRNDPVKFEKPVTVEQLMSLADNLTGPDAVDRINAAESLQENSEDIESVGVPYCLANLRQGEKQLSRKEQVEMEIILRILQETNGKRSVSVWEKILSDPVNNFGFVDIALTAVEVNKIESQFGNAKKACSDVKVRLIYERQCSSPLFQ